MNFHLQLDAFIKEKHEKWWIAFSEIELKIKLRFPTVFSFLMWNFEGFLNEKDAWLRQISIEFWYFWRHIQLEFPRMFLKYTYIYIYIYI
jgi:hypothetical protein